MISSQAFSNDAVSVTRARRFVTATLRDAPAETRDVVELMLSEITSNCVRHTSSSFHVRVDSSVERIRIEVTDQGSGTPELRSPAPTEANGRGLRVVELLSDRWGVLTNEPSLGKTVWFEVANPSVGSFGASAPMVEGGRVEGRRVEGRRQDLAPSRDDHTFRNFPEAALLIDSLGQILMASAQAGRMFGDDGESLIGKALASVLPAPAVRAATESVFGGSLGEGREPESGHTLMVQGVRIDGTVFDAEVRIGAVNDVGPGGPTAVVSVRDAPAASRPDEAEDVWRYFDVAVRLSLHVSRAGSARVDPADDALEPQLGRGLPMAGRGGSEAPRLRFDLA